MTSSLARSLGLTLSLAATSCSAIGLDHLRGTGSSQGGAGGAQGGAGGGGAGAQGGAGGAGAQGGGGAGAQGGAGGAQGGAGGAGGAQGGAGGGGAAAVWNEYRLGASGWTVTPLDTLWTAPTAPPPSGIRTAVRLIDFDRLAIIADDGHTYVRSGQAWLVPRPTDEVFPLLPSDADSDYHIPHALFVLLDPQAPFREQITTLKGTTAYLYEWEPDDTITLTGTSVVDQDPQPMAPPLGIYPPYWTFEMFDANAADPNKRGRIFSLYPDGKIYEFDIGFTYTNWPASQAPVFGGHAFPAGHDLMATRAAYWEMSGDIVLIGP